MPPIDNRSGQEAGAKPGSQSPYMFHAPLITALISGISTIARTQMFEALLVLAKPNEGTRVLDVGVTNDSRMDSNFFEKLYPYPNKIVAVGTEDAAFLEQQYPGLRFQQIQPGPLPFADESFDLVVSFAVLEHVGSRENQRAFINELCRVGRAVCITTPNRWYPIEFHTVLPFVHWLPPELFRKLLRALGKTFLASEDNLNLLSHNDVMKLIPAGRKVATHHIRLLGPISNLLFYIERAAQNSPA